MSLLLNCDLGESYGNWTLGLDAEVMPHIDQANIACGFHGGDPLTMQNTLALAKQHGVSVGAHPAYPDLVGFGRRSLKVSAAELEALLSYQISAIEGMATSQGLSVDYVKPHGALYNDMMADADIRQTILNTIAKHHRPLKLMLQATPQVAAHRAEASAAGVEVLFEAFADRCYDDDGRLLARSKPGAVHSRDKMLAQVKQLASEGSITSVSGQRLEIAADTLCVHGDNAEGVAAIAAIREAIK